MRRAVEVGFDDHHADRWLDLALARRIAERDRDNVEAVLPLAGERDCDEVEAVLPLAGERAADRSRPLIQGGQAYARDLRALAWLIANDHWVAIQRDQARFATLAECSANALAEFGAPE